MSGASALTFNLRQMSADLSKEQPARRQIQENNVLDNRCSAIIFCGHPLSGQSSVDVKHLTPQSSRSASDRDVIAPQDVISSWTQSPSTRCVSTGPVPAMEPSKNACVPPSPSMPPSAPGKGLWLTGGSTVHTAVCIASQRERKRFSILETITLGRHHMQHISRG